MKESESLHYNILAVAFIFCSEILTAKHIDKNLIFSPLGIRKRNYYLHNSNRQGCLDYKREVKLPLWRLKYSV